jgi:type IX secretion system PorP/SprF family membrane protein
MNNLLSKIAVSITLLLFVGTIKAQDYFHISQYMMHQPFINPAAIGSYNTLNGAALYKQQWVGLEGAPSIQAINVNSPLGTSNGNAGFSVVRDQIGVNNRIDISGTYAYNLLLGTDSKLALGLSGMASLNQSNFANATVNDENDPLFANNTQMKVLPNFQYGMYYYTNKFYVGLSLPKLLLNSVTADSLGATNASTSFDFSQMHYYINAGYRFELNENLDLNASTLLKQISGAPFQFDINAQVVFSDKLGVGVSYRSSSELVGLFSYQITDMFKLAYSYDFSLGKKDLDLGAYHSGSHEIMLLFNMPTKEPLLIEPPRF